MNISSPDLSRHLFHIARRSATRLQDCPEVIIPETCVPLPENRLFCQSSDNTGRRILELGSGWGEFLLQWLRMNPTDQLVAMEIKQDRIRRTLKKYRRDFVDQQRLRMIPINFGWFLNEILPPGAFDGIIINFPDPWPKRRHWKHRLVRPGFPGRMAALLRPGGWLHLATDYGPYARRMLHIMRSATEFHSMLTGPDYLRERPADFPPTYFEKIQKAAGYRPFYMQWALSESVSPD
ncbi:MAG: tRNA (guanine-N7)-methyltransferase [Leptospiraceae bacterium]|nr:tRNA (guanine-N7)-methyltransferase [Leptospiraceae bacterium]MCB1321415.1 tRNA (guanine-N7)-methyltransferase [Leptospiraceae bacterium]